MSVVSPGLGTLIGLQALLLSAISPGTSAALPVAAAQPVACAFQLGFGTLHDLIPEIVGDCLENEHHNPDNGDALQRTTGGLLVWRKADNWTAFTDGTTTWINGPEGLANRPNAGPLFPWEAAAPMAGDSGIAGAVTIGSTCPGPTQPGQTCAQPYQATISVLDPQAHIVSQFQTDAAGHIRVSLPPGVYVLHPNPPGNLPLPLARDQTVTVVAGQFTPVQIVYDTGIR